MTAQGITAASYRYYRRSIAAGDGAAGGRPTVSSAVPGVPPGIWHGRAARTLGLAGEVTEAQMRALFGLGLHPNAEEIAAGELAASASMRRAMAAAKLGPALPRLAESSPLEQEIDRVLDHATERLCRPLTKAEKQALRRQTAAAAFEAEYHRRPADGAELDRFLAARTGVRRHARTGYDLTFSSEELSLLFALGDAAVREVVLEVLAQARAETIRWLEEHALAVRTGAGGAAQHRARPGLLATVYLHYTSRAGDPMLHEHVVISPRVQGPDGRWRNLDSRLLLRETVAASELFNQRALELICARLELATEAVETTPGRRPVMRLVGIDPRLRAVFARRSTAVRAAAENLIADYRRRHGRDPDLPARVRLQGRAALTTRPAKPAARSLDDLLADWRRRAIAATDPATVANLLPAARAAAARLRPTTPRPEGERDGEGQVDVAAAAEQVLAAVAARRTTFRRRHVLAEARRHLMRTLRGATAAPGSAEAITDAALASADCLDLTPPDLHPPHPDLARPDGSSVHRPIGSTTYTTRTLLAAEQRLAGAARTGAVPPVARRVFRRVAATHPGPLDTGQKALAASFALSDRLLVAGLGPAGAGKTTAMRLVAAAVDAAGGRLIPLAPSARAAQVLGEDLGRPAHTLHAWLHHRRTAAGGGETDPAFRLGRGDVVLVDEAGMAGTRQLDGVLADAAAAGAVVRLLGDVHQLAAVEAGGALRLIARAGGAVELDRLHRFATPGEADASLVLRDGQDPAEAFAWYRRKGRIVAGTHEAMCDAVFAAWAHDTAAGRTALMTAAEAATVAALNARAQAHRLAAGELDPDRAVVLRSGVRAYVGDVLVTRRNRRRLTVRGGKDFVKNGDTWTLETILPGGDALVRHTRHRGRIRLAADYLAAHTELGYASTVHRAQGMTVDASHALATPAATRESVYVQLTRGARTNRLYLALDAGTALDQTLRTIAARRRAHLSATETIAAAHHEATAPGRLAAEFTHAAEHATTARLTGVLERALGPEQAAALLAADAHPALIRALAQAERAGLDPARLLKQATAGRGLTDADDPAAVLTWRIRARLTDAADAAQTAVRSGLAHMPPARLRTLDRLAKAHRAAARAALWAAEAAAAHLPTPVTTRDGETHPAWLDRPLGPLTAAELAAQTTAAWAAARAAQAASTPLSPAARATLAALHRETALRRALPRQDRAREDHQREQAVGTERSLSAVRRSIADHRATTAARLTSARAALAHADAVAARVAARVAAELRLRDRLPDHPPHRPDHRGEVPDWVADRHALVHPDTPEHWRAHLAERHRLLAAALVDRGHALAADPPAWAHPLGPPPPPTGPRRRAAWAHTCALLELWRTRHARTGVPGLGPRPTDADQAAAWDDLAARIRALRGRRRPTPHPPPPDAPATVVLHAALAHLDTPPSSGPLPDHPALRDPYAVAPLHPAARAARTARAALAATLAGEDLPETWMEEITPPEDDETEHRTYLRLLTAVGDYRRRHHHAGPDPLGPRPSGTAGEEWDHLVDALDLYTRARIERRLERLRERTTAARAATAPPAPLSNPALHPDPHQLAPAPRSPTR
ncbi:hypothetical protein GCM10010405_33980 [Streptomyces macrosporus]|uniref:TrwC relaxase domain-containing protein n=2 Tax=Streptomyces macrosporus TaxID=44032 RepID=A0ABN3K3I2_9ACTN